MSVAILVVLLVILVIAVLIYLKKPVGVDGVSADELEQIKNQNSALRISLANGAWGVTLPLQVMQVA